MRLLGGTPMLKSKLISVSLVIALSGMAVSCTRAASLAITTTSLENGSVGTAYSQALHATGGKAPLSWVISRGALPNGLNLNAGEISGTPSVSGSFSFTILVMDKGGVTTSTTLSITIQRVNAIIVTTNLPEGKIGTKYSQTLTAKGGLPPYRWSLADGDLPVGLTLSGEIISGTPTMAGMFSFTILMEDSAGSSTLVSLSINVLAKN
jgi:hypothetical protein